MRSNDGEHGSRLVVLLAIAALTGSCASDATGTTEPPAATPTDGLRLRFEDAAATVGSVMAGTVNDGPLAVRIEIVTADGGRVTSEPGITGNAARFPAHTDRAGSAAVLVWPAGPDDTLAPGRSPFRFGVDFRLDARSGDAGAQQDNGDNLVQRGLFEDPAQYKLQVDHGVVSCRVAGTEGALVVASDDHVVPDAWYHAECARDRTSLTLSIRPWAEDRWGAERRWHVTGSVGDIRLDPDVPLSIGAKAGRDAVVVQSASDQFNGVLDDVYVDLPAAPGARR